MKILKKVQKLKDFSLALFSKSNKISDTPKGIIDYILSNSTLIINQHLLTELAQITNNSGHTTEIANILTSKLEKFQYNQVAIKNTFVLLQCILYILKNGNDKFPLDISPNKSIFQQLQAINSRYFQNKFMKKSKQLNYTLETIKQKSKYIKNLLQQPQLLSQQRLKLQQFKKDKVLDKLENMENSADCETNINLRKELQEQPVYVMCSNRHKKQGSNTIVQIQEQVMHDIQQSHGKNVISVLGRA